MIHVELKGGQQLEVRSRGDLDTIIRDIVAASVAACAKASKGKSKKCSAEDVLYLIVATTVDVLETEGIKVSQKKIAASLLVSAFNYGKD